MKKIIVLFAVPFVFNSCQNKPENGKVLAKVGSTVITEQYFNEKLEEISQDPNSYLNSKAGKKQFLDMLINEKLVKMASESSSVKNSKEYTEQVNLMKKELDSKLRDFREYLLTRMWLEDLKKKELNVSEKEAEEYYAKYPKAVVIEHLIAGDYETAEKFMKKIKAGTPVSRIVQEEKNSGTVTGGKLPPIMPGEFLPELEDMLYKMRTGEVQGVVKTKLGFHVIKKISEMSLDISKPEIRERVRRVLEKKRFDEYIANVQKKYKVEVLNEDYK